MRDLGGCPCMLARKSCPIFPTAKDQSKFLGQLPVQRSQAASVVLSNNTLWVTGGIDKSHKPIKTTEFVTKDGQTSQGPDLPLPVSEHGNIKSLKGFIGIKAFWAQSQHSLLTLHYPTACIT